MDLEQKFFTKLTQIAKLSNTEVGEEIFELYDKEVSPFGYDKACDAIDRYMREQRGVFRFPQLGDLLQHLNPSVCPDSEATDAASRVIEAISKYGPYRSSEAKDFMGELAWQIVQREGSWMSICESLTYENLGTMRAQWKKLALSLLEMAKAGRLNDPPRLTDRTVKSSEMKQIGEIINERLGIK